MMERRHYELLARAIRQTIEQAEQADYRGIALLRHNLEQALAADNPNFDLARFHKAAGSITAQLNARSATHG